MNLAILVLRLLAVLTPFAAGVALRLRQRLPPRASPQRRASRLPTVVTYLGVLLLIFLLFLPFPELSDPLRLLLAALGLLFVHLGSAVMAWARITLGAAWSLMPQAGASGLVTSGPYAWVRHPVYTGFALGLVGAALSFASWPALLVFILIVLPSLLWRASVEERLLLEVFGEEYSLYRQRTRMLLPYLL